MNRRELFGLLAAAPVAAVVAMNGPQPIDLFSIPMEYQDKAQWYRFKGVVVHPKTVYDKSTFYGVPVVKSESMPLGEW